MTDKETYDHAVNFMYAHHRGMTSGTAHDQSDALARERQLHRTLAARAKARGDAPIVLSRDDEPDYSGMSDARRREILNLSRGGQDVLEAEGKAEGERWQKEQLVARGLLR